uniref:Uncharacterized protein n=1 Tax=Romanomermis culicivorax TaxID=13658 RepID=A0A915JCY6_ROMCU
MFDGGRCDLFIIPEIFFREKRCNDRPKDVFVFVFYCDNLRTSEVASYADRRALSSNRLGD